MTYVDFTNLSSITGELTADDIAEGLQGSCEHCPVALAVGRMFEGFEVYAELNMVSIHQRGEIYEVLRVSDRLADWMENFDLENGVSPIGLQISTWNTGGYKYMIDIREATP